MALPEAEHFVRGQLTPRTCPIADIDLIDDHDYSFIFRSICKGLAAYERVIPAENVDLHVTYFNNLRFSSGIIVEEPKPEEQAEFVCFADYHSYLNRAADRLARNMSSPQRRWMINPLATISTGYDSCGSAVVAGRFGCRESVTFRTATSFWRGSDSGQQIAQHLGMNCTGYPRCSKSYCHEEFVWAVTGRGGIMNWTLFDYPRPLCLLFTGCQGDKIWKRTDIELPDPFVSPSVADHGFGEFRLIRGVFHCPVPFWGIPKPTRSAALGCYQRCSDGPLGATTIVQYLAALRRKREFLVGFLAIARRTRPLSLFCLGPTLGKHGMRFLITWTSGIQSSSGLPG